MSQEDFDISVGNEIFFSKQIPLEFPHKQSI